LYKVSQTNAHAAADVNGVWALCFQQRRATLRDRASRFWGGWRIAAAAAARAESPAGKKKERRKADLGGFLFAHAGPTSPTTTLLSPRVPSVFVMKLSRLRPNEAPSTIPL
jgi:hypothetical protein